MAEKDELTGLLNAGSLFRLLEAELQSASERKTRVAVIVLDLDGFKQANDQYGHLAGNRVLQEIARGLTESSRQTDHVARLGGDEFAIVAPGIDQANLAGLTERIRSLGPAAGIEAWGAPRRNINIGVALYPADGTDPESLLERADQLMYEAKKENKLARALSAHRGDLTRLNEATAAAGADSNTASEPPHLVMKAPRHRPSPELTR
jgi:diguanylate cyclase (GGDEF)-like protein